MNFLFFDRKFFLPLLMCTFLFMACEDDDDVVDIIDEPVSIAEELDQDADFTILTAALIKAGLYDTLTQGNFTIFAPDNAAFIAAGITNLDRFTAEYLENLLLYHVIDNELTYSDLNNGALETLNGEVYLDGVDFRPFINGDAEFIQINFEATNGVIHVIDEVLFPPEQNVASFIGEEPNLSILQEAIQQAGLEETLSEGGPFTIFAPTNLAFEVLFDEMGINGLDELSDEELGNILAYHVVPDRLFSSSLQETDYNTLAEEEFGVVFLNYIVLRDNNVETENAVIVNGNNLTTNGLVHKIDRVMLPAE